MASDRTIAKRLEHTRTWRVAYRDSKGEQSLSPYNALVTAALAKRRQDVQTVRIPSKREREAMRAQKEIDRGKEESDQAQAASPEDR